MSLENSKYPSMPDNSYFDSRMANGDKLSDIFDRTDFLSRCYTEDKARPITVKVGKKYNFVANNYLLFDNWFVSARDFEEDDEYTYAYRRFNEKGIVDGGVLIRRDGSYVTREEFAAVEYGTHVGGGRYAFVKQQNGLLNIIDLEKGTKLEQTGIRVDSITYAHSNFIDFGLFRIAKGNFNGLHDLDWATVSHNSPKDSINKGIEVNLYSVEKGILFPDTWFDYIETFGNSYNGIAYDMCKYTIVHLNGKLNVINRYGRIMFDKWFDIGHVNSENEAIVGILKSDQLKGLQDYNEDYSYNPEKYTLYKIDKYGKIRQLT